jgi:hypothetical protein
MDTAHVSTWLHCLTASPVLEHALSPTEWNSLTEWLDLPPSYGGSGLNSLVRSADEELLGSFAGIAASLISFCRKTELPIYITLAQALEAMGDGTEALEEENPPSDADPCASIEAIEDDASRAECALSPLSTEELALATELVRGHSRVEVPGRWNRNGDAPLDVIVLPEPRSLADFVTAPWKQEVSLMRQTRQARQASNLFKSMDPVRQTLMRATSGQCGRDTAHCSVNKVKAVATMECPAALPHAETSEASPYFTTTLHIYGLRLRKIGIPHSP